MSDGNKPRHLTPPEVEEHLRELHQGTRDVFLRRSGGRDYVPGDRESIQFEDRRPITGPDDPRLRPMPPPEPERTVEPMPGMELDYLPAPRLDERPLDLDTGAQTLMNFYDADMDMGRNAIRRVEVKSVDDDGEIQRVIAEGLDGEIFDLAYRGQPHGLTTNPTPGSIGYVFMANGRPDQAFLIGMEHPDIRPRKLKPGETQLYAKKKQRILHDDNGDQRIDTPEGTVYINT